MLYQGWYTDASRVTLVVFHLADLRQVLNSYYLQVCFNMSYFTNTVSVVAYIHICRLLQLQYLQRTPLKINILKPFYIMLLFDKIENNIDSRVKGICQFPCSYNCETRIFFSQNIPETPVTSQTSVRRPTQKLLTQVPDFCPSTNAETIESMHSCMSFDWRWKYWLESQSSVLLTTQKLLTHIPAICPLTVTTTNDSRPRRLSSDRYRN